MPRKYHFTVFYVYVTMIKNSKSIIKYLKSKPIITFGTSESSDFRAQNVKTLEELYFFI